MNASSHERGGVKTTSSAVTFSHPFRLGQDSRELPPGTYMLQTDEHLFTSGNRGWSARAEIVVEVQQGSHVTYRHVSPADLDQAIARDAERTTLLYETSENPDRGLAPS